MTGASSPTSSVSADVELGQVEEINSGSTIHRRTRNMTESTVSSTNKDEIEPTVVGVVSNGSGTIAESLEEEEGNQGEKTQVDQELNQERLYENLSHWEGSLLRKYHSILPNLLSRNPRFAKVFRYIDGPNPAITRTSIKPLLPRVEAFFNRLLSPFVYRRALIVPLFLIGWFFGFSFFVRSSAFSANTPSGVPTYISADSSFWSKNDLCGLNGTLCQPFTNNSIVFRCAGQSLATILLNENAVGTQELNFETLVVGGLDPLSTYRADSWICAAAIQHGLFTNQKGGCGRVNQIGAFEGFVGGSKNGVNSVGFDTVFPSSYRFEEGMSSENCADLRDGILGFNVAMTVIFTFIIRPPPSVWYWVMFIVGYWHVVLVSDPTSTPPNVSVAFEYFLPALFVALAFWRYSFRYVVPAFEFAILEKTIWYLAGFWIGVLINTSLAWIPIDRLTPSDIAKRPGSLVAVICVAIFLLLVILNQLREIRKTGWFFFYLKWYAVGVVIIGLLIAVPGQQFRMHHYIAALALIPGCAFVTRPSALFQGFLLGMFLDGVGRWGFDSILQTAAVLNAGSNTGSPLPVFLTTAMNFTAGQTQIRWNDLSSDLVGQGWNGFAVIVDDVLAWTGTGTNYTLAGLDTSLPHYFRLAYQASGASGDFTQAATAFIANGTWIDAAPGPG